MSLPIRIDVPTAPTLGLDYSWFATDGDVASWDEFEEQRLTGGRSPSEPAPPDRGPSGLDGVTLAEIVRELSAEVARDEEEGQFSANG